jgi:hypothetical protein
MTEVRTPFIAMLARLSRALDPSQLMTTALMIDASGHMKIVDDPLGEALDRIGALTMRSRRSRVNWAETGKRRCMEANRIAGPKCIRRISIATNS